MNEGYYYSWEDGFSTHPEWNYNKKSIIKCNGVEQRRVLCCLTGKDGFVKKVKIDNEDRAVHTAGPTLVMEFFMGHVTVEFD